MTDCDTCTDSAKNNTWFTIICIEGICAASKLSLTEKNWLTLKILYHILFMYMCCDCELCRCTSLMVLSVDIRNIPCNLLQSWFLDGVSSCQRRTCIFRSHSRWHQICHQIYGNIGIPCIQDCSLNVILLLCFYKRELFLHWNTETVLLLALQFVLASRGNKYSQV